MEEKYKEPFEFFLKTWGEKSQMLMCIEEMSELTKAICKYNRTTLTQEEKEKTINNVKEEIADVLNMTEQLEFLFGEEEIKEIRDNKIHRTIEKIGKEKFSDEKKNFLIVVASENEYEQIRPLTDKPILKMGIGTPNVIEALKNIDKDTFLINIGYAGSNKIPRGTIVKVKNSRSYHPVADFDFYEKIYTLNGDVDCYTSSDFVTCTTIEEPVLFDMELNTICALGYNVESYKVVSDCLCLKECEEANFTNCWKKILKEVNKKF